MKAPAARALGWVLVSLCVLALVITVVSSTVISANNTETIRQAQQTNTETLDLIKSCTTPGRKCFNEGQERTGKAVGSINKITVYAATCADRPGWQDVAEIEACIRAKLARNAAR